MQSGSIRACDIARFLACNKTAGLVERACGRFVRTGQQHDFVTPRGPRKIQHVFDDRLAEPMTSMRLVSHHILDDGVWTRRTSQVQYDVEIAGRDDCAIIFRDNDDKMTVR